MMQLPLRNMNRNGGDLFPARQENPVSRDAERSAFTLRSASRLTNVLFVSFAGGGEIFWE
jgi:hypothetical protein